MARCWTCGIHVNGNHYTCPHCKSLSELKRIRNKVESYGGNISDKLNYMTQVQREEFAALRTSLQGGLSEIASAIEWGLGELIWELQQQTDTLRSIDHTLRTPSETQANEWRIMAEELRYRGVLDQSEEFYLKALELNPLDYRIYVGLAETYLQSNKFDNAKTFLEKSLPHAPNQEIDYRSYSQRLIGHIYACIEDYSQAALTLYSAIELSPNYVEGTYDYVKYCAQIEKKDYWIDNRLPVLEWIIINKHLYFYLAQHEQCFEKLRSEVEGLLSKIKTEAFRKVEKIVTESENTLKQAAEVISDAEHALTISRERDTLDSSTMYGQAKSALKIAKDKIALDDYLAFLEAKPIAEQCQVLATNTRKKAHEERRNYEEKRREKVKSAWAMGLGTFFLYPPLCGAAVAIVGAILGAIVPGKDTAYTGLVMGFCIGVAIGLVVALCVTAKELD